MKVAKIKKDRPVPVSELYIYTGVTEGIIDEKSTKHNMFFTEKKRGSPVLSLPLLFHMRP